MPKCHERISPLNLLSISNEEQVTVHDEAGPMILKLYYWQCDNDNVTRTSASYRLRLCAMWNSVLCRNPLLFRHQRIGGHDDGAHSGRKCFSPATLFMDTRSGYPRSSVARCKLAPQCREKIPRRITCLRSGLNNLRAILHPEAVLDFSI